MYLALTEEFPAPHAGYVHTLEITRNLSKLGIEIELFVRPSEQDQLVKEICGVHLNYVVFPNIKSFFRYSSSQYFNSFLRIKNCINKFDIIHERFSREILSSFLPKGKAKYILEINSPIVEEEEDLPRFLLYSFVRSTKLRKCDAIITQTDTLKNILSKHTKKPIFIVPNGVDIERFNPGKYNKDLRRSYALKNEIIVTFVGTFRKWHGALHILEMAKRIKDAKFLLIGEGEKFKEIKKESRGIDNVILTGAIRSERIPEILATSDILIAPFDVSSYKSLEKYGFWWCPVKLFEYMAVGKPIVSFGFKEVRNIVRDAGLLAKPGNLNQFVEYLNVLIKNRKLREELGKKGREIAEREYSWEKRAKETLKVYKKIIS